MCGRWQGENDFGPWKAGISEGERIARCRGMRAICLLYLGDNHALVHALAVAEADASVLERALGLLDALPSLRRRRILAAYATLAMPRRRGHAA